MAKWLGILSMGVFFASIICAWMLIPIPVAPASALDLQIQVSVGGRTCQPHVSGQEGASLLEHEIKILPTAHPLVGGQCS
jgi:hypothetical protein